MEHVVFFISDRTGITVETLGHSLLTQFEDMAFHKQIRRFIDSPDKARAVAAEIRAATQANGTRPIVFSTLIDPEIRRIVAGAGGVSFDFVDTFIAPLEAELGRHSSHTIGRSHGLVDAARYNLRINAVNYALATDDGQSPQSHGQADVIVLGVSRSGKTPTCLYLALSFGIYAANYPLTMDDLGHGRLPLWLAPHGDRCYGLTIDPVRLQQIRHERRPGSEYAALKQCQQEVRQAEALYRQYGIAFVSSTTMSVEEIATTILSQKKLRPRLS